MRKQGLGKCQEPCPASPPRAGGAAGGSSPVDSGEDESAEEGGPSFADTPGEGEARRRGTSVAPNGPCSLGELTSRGVGSEQTLHQGPPLDEFSHGASPLSPNPHVHGGLGKLETALRQTRAGSVCADDGRKARAIRCSDCPPEAALCESTFASRVPHVRASIGRSTSHVLSAAVMP
ncbi:hypothetical protein Efla_002867 [Eimeria flavescens]